MGIKNRHGKIVEIVRKNKTVSVEELASLLDISRETIRRDLSKLSNIGKVHKIHGGATLPQGFGEGPFQKRLSENTEAKVHIAKTAATLFSEDETLFVDTGSTTLYFAEALSSRAGLTIITNSTEVAMAVSRPKASNKVFLLGGEFNSDNRQTVGTIATSQIRSFRAKHAVLTIGAMDIQSGVMDFNIEEAQIARLMIEQSQSLTVLVDSSKFNHLAPFEVCGLKQIDRLICDRLPPENLMKALKLANVKVIVAS